MKTNAPDLIDDLVTRFIDAAAVLALVETHLAAQEDSETMDLVAIGGVKTVRAQILALARELEAVLEDDTEAARRAALQAAVLETMARA